jgi:hypothetical protein
MFKVPSRKALAAGLGASSKSQPSPKGMTRQMVGLAKKALKSYCNYSKVWVAFCRSDFTL